MKFEKIFSKIPFFSQKLIFHCLEIKIFLRKVDFFYFRSHECSEFLAHDKMIQVAETHVAIVFHRFPFARCILRSKYIVLYGGRYKNVKNRSSRLVYENFCLLYSSVVLCKYRLRAKKTPREMRQK